MPKIRERMSRVFIIGAALALAARLTVFAEPGTVEAVASFGAFWFCAAGWFVSFVTS
jgi:hypothetical protein